ncbi:MAG TPA: serine/threonine-protein kinase [Gemmatimonadales bacterium]|nr:serine/threonine-protein kinase [Gemmatimonadales bacterium]
MRAPQWIGHHAETTPAPLRSSRGHHRELPPDLLRDASHRVGVIALLAGILWILGTALGHLAFRAIAPGQPWLRFETSDGIAVVSAAASFGLAFYARKTTREPRFVLDLGLAFMVFTSVALGIVWHTDTAPPGWTIIPTISWIGVVVLMFAAIIPSVPVKTLVSGLLAVSMNPLGMLLAKASGHWDYGSNGNLLLMHYPDYLLVGVAVAISAVVTRLGQQVTKARELGSYQVGDLLGEGGMGQVFLATHRMLARPAAIKLIRPEAIGGSDPAARDLAVKRFHREAEVAANLRSPHTVELYDFGATEDGTLYFVMELLDGVNLESLVRQHGPLPPNRVIHILRQVCDSLEEAHARGLVHRDIKPANIHLGRLGLRHDFVKVLDFGLVKSVKTQAGDSSLATATGMTPGTPDYMAPEMTLGGEIDGRADLYALGCVAYYLLTGMLLFEASNVFHAIARHLNDPPVPPSVRAGVAVPPALEALVLACVAKRPEDRPATAAALNDALAAVPVEPWGEAQAAAWWRAHAVPPGLSAAG